METDFLSSSLEDYLEAIFLVGQEKNAVRPGDITRRMGVGNSSVTRALHVLSERGMILHAPYDHISLTDRGRGRAKELVSRHRIFREFFTVFLCIEGKEADDMACKMEHALTRSAYCRFAAFMKYIRSMSDFRPCTFENE